MRSIKKAPRMTGGRQGRTYQTAVWLPGSYTIEASILVPMTVMLVMAVLWLALNLYNNVTIQYDTCRELLLNVQKTEDPVRFIRLCRIFELR